MVFGRNESDGRPVCEYSEETNDAVLECQMYAVMTCDGTHYCEKHAQEDDTVPYIP